MADQYARLVPRMVTAGLEFPEGPVACSDGSLLVTEIRGGRITRVSPDGSKSVFAVTGGGPNGAAIGPDGALYVCNNGGSKWARRAWPYADPAAIELLLPAGHSHDGIGPLIQRVNAEGTTVEVLYASREEIPLCRPNDLVFDREGGFWFTDMGGVSGRKRDLTGVFHAKADGSRIAEAIFPLDMPNGIGLSPDERTLYIVETRTRRLWACELAEPGRVRTRRTLATIPSNGPLGFGGCDSLCVDSAGNILVATLGAGGVTVISPLGDILAFVRVGDPMTTNVCFGGESLRTLYVTCSTRGELLAFDNWPVPGLPPNFSL